jgi:hypothetical protein
MTLISIHEPWRPLLLLVLLLAGHLACAQGEVLMPLTMRPVEQPPQLKTTGRIHFIFQNEPQNIPVMDDFSINRTRNRWASPNDEGVVLDQTIQHLEVDGISTPDMAFSLDTTFFYLTTVNDEGISTERTPLPEIQVLVNNLNIYPVEGDVVTAWPAYNVFDTIPGNNTPDTLDLVGPDLIQDSLMVYVAPPSTETYIMGNEVTPLVLWEDDDVYINNTYPVLPPTIGVATFDGLSRTGLPYDFMNASAHGIADRLTSVPINLQRPASDSIYLSFFYQARGLSGDIHGQEIDSLALEFYAPLEDLWYPVWSTPYDAMNPSIQPPFRQVMIPIREFRYLQDGFRMRFFNYATLSGSFDHWHLDYVRLGAQRSRADTVIVDVAYVYPASSLLETFTSVPYENFKQTPATLMAGSVTMPQRNLDVNDRFIDFGFRVGVLDEPLQNFETGINTANNASSVFNSVHPISSNHVYATPPEEGAMFYDVRFWTRTQPDLNSYNDTTRFVQEISNYYSYDDGSAEAGYGLNTAGGKLAYSFPLLGPGELRAVRMYFNPMSNQPPAAHPTTGSFLLTIWQSLDPEVIIHQNFSFSSPEYRDHGLNKFVEYPLDSVINVSGTIFVGWAQTNNVPMNLGFDRNRNNQNRIFFNVGNQWQNTVHQGSLMMRPVFVSDVDPWTGVEEPDQAITAPVLHLYPNPTNDAFRIQVEDGFTNGHIQCMDAMGRVVAQERYTQGMFISTAGLSDGVYLVRLLDVHGSVHAHSRLIVQR